jgi:hypothetical protein
LGLAWFGRLDWGWLDWGWLEADEPWRPRGPETARPQAAFL